MHAASSIERILSHGKKQSTYKLAVLRALVEYVTEQPAQEPRNGLHRIPVIELARRVLAYYWRPTLSGIRQGRTGREAIPASVETLRDSNLTIKGIDLTDPKAGLALAAWIEETAELPKPVCDALLDIRDSLLKQPLHYIHNVPGSSVSFFSLFTRNGPGLVAEYEAHRKAAPGKRELRASSWSRTDGEPGMLEKERADLVLSARTYEEISELRFWLRDSIVLRWARECEEYSPENAPAPVNAFDLSPLERDSSLITRVKTLYTGLGFDRCLYTERPLPALWDLDHLLPWSRFPVNLFWNLVPSHPDANRGKGGKFDLLPVFDDGLELRYREFLRTVVGAGGDLVDQQLGATYRRYFQEDGPAEDVEEQVAKLRGIVDSSWKRLDAAGVGLWDAPG